MKATWLVNPTLDCERTFATTFGESRPVTDREPMITRMAVQTAIWLAAMACRRAAVIASGPVS